MGRHATIGNSNVGHKNTTLKEWNKTSMMARVYAASKNPFPVKTEAFEPLPEIIIKRATPFAGINPVYGQDFTQVSPIAYKLRVKDASGLDCYVGLMRVTVKPQDGKAYGVWMASYAGQRMPLVSNRGQALGLAEAKDKLFQLLVINAPAKRPASIIPAEPKVKTAKAYFGGDITKFVIYASRDGRKIRYSVPEDKTSGEIIDDMRNKGYTIDRIANS